MRVLIIFNTVEETLAAFFDKGQFAIIKLAGPLTRGLKHQTTGEMGENSRGSL